MCMLYDVCELEYTSLCSQFLCVSLVLGRRFVGYVVAVAIGAIYWFCWLPLMMAFS